MLGLSFVRITSQPILESIHTDQCGRYGSDLEDAALCFAVPTLPS